jgi:hypothetical protein
LVGAVFGGAARISEISLGEDDITPIAVAAKTTAPIARQASPGTCMMVGHAARAA